MEKVREAGKRRGSIIVPPPPAGPGALDAMGLPKLSIDVSFEGVREEVWEGVWQGELRPCFRGEVRGGIGAACHPDKVLQLLE